MRKMSRLARHAMINGLDECGFPHIEMSAGSVVRVMTQSYVNLRMEESNEATLTLIIQYWSSSKVKERTGP